MNFKKIFIRILALVLVFPTFFLVACEGGTQNNELETGKSFSQKTQIADTDILLVNNGTTDYKIVVAENCNIAENYAANQLSKYIGLATSISIPIITDLNLSYDENASYISIGTNKLYNNSGIMVSYNELNGDGYKIIRKGNQVFIKGATYEGTIYGVYEFLSYEIGFEPYDDDEIYYENKTSILLKDFNYIDTPDFAVRYFDLSTFKYAEERSMFRFNTQREGEEIYGSTDIWIPSNCETMLKFVPKDTYLNSDKPDTYHPEWWPSDTKGNPCLTNESLIKTFADNAIQLVINKPNGKILSISEEDGGKLCGCDKCNAEINKYGQSGYFIRFCNKIIEKVEAWRLENCPERELYYSTFAYQSGTIHPPVNKNEDGTFTIKDESCRPHEKLYIKLAPIGACYYHAFNDKECKTNQALMDDINGWCSITDKFQVWDYDCNFHHFAMFFDNFGTLQKNLQLYKQIGVTNIIRQNTKDNQAAPFLDLKQYLESKLMWNTDLDMSLLIDNFFTHYYKDAAPYVRQYFNLLRSHLKMLDIEKNHENHIGVYDVSGKLITEDVWPKNIIEQANSLLNKAYEVCDKMEDKVTAKLIRDRITVEGFHVRYVKIKNYYAYGLQQKDYGQFIDDFYKDATRLGLTHIKENQNNTIDKWYESIRVK